jgi:hypothetical protein
MQMQQVSSSQVQQMGHDPSTGIMHVMFKNGSVYEYSNVSAEEFNQLLNAPSIGAVIRRAVAGKPYHKIGD